MPTCSRQARIRFGAFLIILRVASTIQLHKTFLKCNDSKVMNVLNVQKNGLNPMEIQVNGQVSSRMNLLWVIY